MTAAQGTRPNVVIVLTDDMGWGDLGCYGATAIPTPNMDRVAREGARLTDAHSCSALCSPSRYGVLTGRYSWRGPLKRGVLVGHSPAIIERDRPTIASILRSTGYATAAIGKWHLGLGWHWNDGSRLDAWASDPSNYVVTDRDRARDFDVDYTRPFTGGPLDLGFERFFGISGALDMPPYCFLDQDRTLGVPDLEKEIYHDQLPGLQVAGWRDDEVDVRFAAEAAGWIREQADSKDPFFLYCATASPHRPCVPPAFIQGASRAGQRGDCVALADWVVGEILHALDDTGAAANTLVIVTSDNGAPIFPEDGTDVTVHSPNGHWRGQKADIWDGGHREPFVARWPGRIPAGLVLSDLVCLTDLVATVASAAGAPVPEQAAEDSVDILPILTGETSMRPERAVVHHSAAGAFSIRQGRWKSIFTTGSGGGFTNPGGRQCDATQPEGQLYDIEADPTEIRNLWNIRTDLVAELYEDLKRICIDASSGLSFDIPLDEDRKGFSKGTRFAALRQSAYAASTQVDISG